MDLTLAPLFSGSQGNSIYVASGRTRVLVDAGRSVRQIEAELQKAGGQPGALSGILVTHEHIDHVRSIGGLSRKYDVPVYANEGTWTAMERRIGKISLKNIRVIGNEDFYIQDLCVQPFRTSHDAACSCGYTLGRGPLQVTVMTDLGCVTKEILDLAGGSRIVLLESNYDEEMLANGPYSARLKRRIASNRGHLSNPDAGRAAVALAARGVRGILLSHLSENNNTYGRALQTVNECLRERGIVRGRHIALDVARRDGLTGVFTLSSG